MRGWLSNEDRERLVERLRSATVLIRGRYGNGSGVAWPSGRLVVTCNHVIRDREVEILAPREDGPLAGRLLRRHPRSDVALLGPSRYLGDSGLEVRREPLRPGELLFAMGNPWGEPGVLTSGVLLSAPGQEGFIAADLRVAPGNSGGPMVDSRGRLVGIVSMYSGGAAVAVPVSHIEALTGPASETTAA